MNEKVTAEKQEDQQIDRGQQDHVEGDQRKESDGVRILRCVENEIVGQDQR